MRLSLRSKVAGGFGLLLVLILVLGWVTVSLFGSLRSVQRSVFDDAIPGLVTVDEIVRAYTAQSAAVRGYLIGSRSELLDEYNTEVATAELWERRGQNLFKSSEEQGLLGQLVDAGHHFQRLVGTRVIPLVQHGDRSQAFRVLGQNGTPLISQVGTLGSLLRDAQDKEVAQAESNVRSHSNRSIIILAVVLGGAFIVGVLIAVVVPRRLVRDLDQVVEAARGIGRGDFNQRLDIHSGDEVEELAERFNEMQSGLKRLQQLALQDRELEIAASIQRNLLQRTLPETPGARLIPLQQQANLVGGDWYDVDVTGRVLTVVVGDASGKGIAAALMATVALSALRAERGLGASPARLIERANKALRDATDADSFTTLLYSSIDLRSGEARWLNMGHPSPFLLKGRPSDSERPNGYYLEGPRNKALGWFEDPGLAETVITLEPGDRLVVYTDGFLEAKAPDGEVFGPHRFAEAVLRAAALEGELGDELVREVERFAAGKLDDDLTMLVVEFHGAELAAENDARTGDEAWHSRR